MKKHFKIILLVIVIIIVFIIGIVTIKKNSEKKYISEEMIGMTRSSIIDEYGAFDKVFYDDAGDKVTMGWYIIEERKQTIMGLREEKYFVVIFEDDLAKETYERVGNIGG